ncbi:MAG: hypothetical protein ACRECC_14635 [Pseudolabrys sp.]|jgi:hypothetical protein
MVGHRSRGIVGTCALAALGALLAACSTDKPPVGVQNIFPAKYKDEILLTFPRLVADPTNVRDAYVTDPILNEGGPVKVYYACVRGNARNFNHEYTGSKDWVGYFYGGHLGQLVEAPPELCAKAAYKPFPELEKLCLGNTCK